MAKVALIMDMVEKKGMLVERPFLMEFIERFLGIHHKKISKIHPELFEQMKVWATRQKVQYIVAAREYCLLSVANTS